MLFVSNLTNAQMYFTLEHTFYFCSLQAYHTADSQRSKHTFVNLT